MIRIVLIVSMMTCAGVAQAQNVNGNYNGNNNTGIGTGNGNGNGNGNASSATINNNRSRNTPSVFAPGLAAAGTETCLGSATIGGSGPGIGLIFGTTLTDKGCNLRLYSRTLHALGHKRAATQILCNDPEVAVALSYEGVICGTISSAATFGSSRTVASVETGARDARMCRQYDLFRGCLD